MIDGDMMGICPPSGTVTDLLTGNHVLTHRDYQSVYDVHSFINTMREEEQAKDNYSERYEVICLAQSAVSTALDALRLLERKDRQPIIGKD